MNLNEYYLVKVFSKEKYMTDFNSGKNIYINSTSFFWKLENAFQQDEEGAIVRQSGRGYIIQTTPDVIHNSNSLDEILKCCNEKNKGRILAQISETTLKLNGYLCCFYLLPRKSVKFTKTTMSFIDERELKDFHLFLEKYIESSNDIDFYVSIYEPNTFCEIFFKGMKDKGYEIVCGKVKYEENPDLEKIRLYQAHEYAATFFIKPLLYNYQKEFRILITKQKEQIKDHISENNIDIYNSVIGTFSFKDLNNTESPQSQ